MYIIKPIFIYDYIAMQLFDIFTNSISKSEMDSTLLNIF